MIYYSLFIQRRDHKIRNQVAWQQRVGSTQFHSLHAVRAVTGHRQCTLLDPLRFAVPAPPPVQGQISGLFHLTDADNIPSILQRGMVPGGMRAGRRMDVHFTAFSIFEDENRRNRGVVVARRLREAQGSARKLAQISLDVDRAWPDMRLCVTNGYFLSKATLGPRLIDSIVTATGMPQKDDGNWSFSWIVGWN